MKNILFLALRYLRFNKIKTAIMVFSITVAVCLPLSVNLLVRDYQRNLLTRSQSTPLVAGAPGSRIDLVMHALYFRGKPAHDLTMADVETINQSGLALAIPIIGKHTARGFPIVGTSLEYFRFRGLCVGQGAGLVRVGDCVLGAAVAAKLGLKPGDKLMSDPENVFDLAGTYPLNMTVKGILTPAGTADDGAVFTDFKTEWIILGLMHGHQDAAQADPSLLLGRSEGNVVASAAVLPYQEITSTNLLRFHAHGDTTTFPVSAIVVVPHDEKSAAILRGRYMGPKATVQLLVPTQVISETLDLVFRVKKFFDTQSLLVGVAMALLLALVVLLSLRLRRSEMETMFKLGCARGTAIALQAAEIVIVVTLGVALAAGLAWIVLWKLGLSSPRTSLRPSAFIRQPEVNAKPRVAVVNYPLWYFTKRIAGDHVETIYPVPRTEDPAFWQPGDRDIPQYQSANVIFLNGAEYEKWLPTTVLPLTNQIVTSATFADRYLTNGEVVTHTHGAGGLHSHGMLDFNTWLDPAQAAQQAQCIYDELVKLVPSAATEFAVNLQQLQSDLTTLDAKLAAASAALGHSPLLGSHPVYQYVARHYGWDLKCVHWESDEMPPDEEWKNLETLHAKHPANLMIWEKTPLPAVAARLRKLGIEPVVFETCASEPDGRDYFKAMNANAERLASAR